MSTLQKIRTVTGNQVELDVSNEACLELGHPHGEIVDAISNGVFINWGKVIGVNDGFLYVAFDGHMGKVNSVNSMDLKKRLTKKVKIPSGHELEMNISDHICELLGFKYNERFYVNNLGVYGNVIGAAPLPEGFGVECVDKGANVLWVELEKEDGKQICFFPDPKHHLEKVLSNIHEVVEGAKKGSGTLRLGFKDYHPEGLKSLLEMHERGTVRLADPIEDVRILQSACNETRYRIFVIHLMDDFDPNWFEAQMCRVLDCIETITNPKFATLKKKWEMRDGDMPPALGAHGDDANVKKGRYEIERIRNPHKHDGYWLVIKGTKTGMAEAAWGQWTKEGGWESNDNFLITFE